MKISRTSATSAHSGTSPSQKSITSLVKGDTFTATVAGVSGGQVSLTMPGGGRMTATTQNPDSLIKGEQLNFIVETSENGQIFVKITNEADGRNLFNIAAKVLAEAKLPANDQNLSLAKKIIEKGLSIDSKKMRDASSGMALGTMNIEKLMFLLEEDIEICEESLKQLNNNIFGREGLASKIEALIEKAARLPEDVRNEVFHLMLGKSFGSSDTKDMINNELIRKLFIAVRNEGEKEPEAFYKNLYSAVLRVLNGLSESEDTKELIDTVRQIKSSLDFQKEISQYRQFMQLPFIFDGSVGQGDLYIFKDKNRVRTQKKNASALLCLNMANVGYVEAFITKNESSVSCIFRFSELKYIDIFKDNLQSLRKLLAKKGLMLEQASFEHTDGPFNLLKEPPGQSTATEFTQKKYSFDVRT